MSNLQLSKPLPHDLDEMNTDDILESIINTINTHSVDRVDRVIFNKSRAIQTL